MLENTNDSDKNIKHNINNIKSFREMPRSGTSLGQLVYNRSKIDYVARKVNST